MSSKIDAFLNSSPIFIVGASLTPSKFGFKVLEWYKRLQDANSNSNKYLLVPIHPKETSMLGIPAFASISDYLHRQHQNLPVPMHNAAIHFISPPAITMKVIQEWTLDNSTKRISKVWCQPGSIDAESDGLKVEQFLTTIPGSVFIYNGPCILRDATHHLISSSNKL